MNDDVWKRDEIESPCVKVCVDPPRGADLHRLPAHHRRDRALVADDAQERRAIMEALPGRAGQIAKRRGGRAGRLSRG